MPGVSDTRIHNFPQPIAPANNLVPLPYNAAVAARFPDPATRYDTPGLAPQRNQFTTASELSSWLNSQASKSLGRDTRLGIVQPGSSQRGSPIQALVATRAPGIQPSALYDSRRPTVMLVAGQHGDEPAGTEALLIIARELAPGGLLEPLLQQINVILVPRANPDAVEAGTRNAADGTDIALGGTVPKLIPKALEGSNVSAIEAMTRLIDQSRSFETQIRIIKEMKSLDESGASMMKTA